MKFHVITLYRHFHIFNLTMTALDRLERSKSDSSSANYQFESINSRLSAQVIRFVPTASLWQDDCLNKADHPKLYVAYNNQSGSRRAIYNFQMGLLNSLDLATDKVRKCSHKLSSVTFDALEFDETLEEFKKLFEP